jgi:hypothetical protein
MRRLFISASLALSCTLIGLLTPQASLAQQSDADLAKALSNPVASLISVPLQFNYDQDMGPGDRGERLLLNVQPVVPIGLNEDWNVISRTILPLTWQDDVVPGEGTQFGLGDTVQSLFLSPVAPTSGGLIWGAGPVFLLPTATEDTLGSEKWGAGPTVVGLRQSGPWTYGLLANHIWSFAGDGGRNEVNASFVQPFITYTTPGALTIALNSETTYDWQASEAAIPINLQLNQLFNIEGQRVQIGGGLRYWAKSSRNGPEGLGARFNVVFLFPK